MTGKLNLWLSTDDVIRLYKLERGTLYRWASEDGWRRIGTRRHRLWCVDDVQASHDRRRGDTPPDLTQTVTRPEGDDSIVGDV